MNPKKDEMKLRERRSECRRLLLTADADPTIPYYTFFHEHFDSVWASPFMMALLGDSFVCMHL